MFLLSTLEAETALSSAPRMLVVSVIALLCAAPPMLDDPPMTDDGWEARAVAHMASPSALYPLFDKLQRGRPISIGLLGASVGQ
eukprot:4208624-Prymnesium_polylepis.1